jgi:hypothetical protein
MIRAMLMVKECGSEGWEDKGSREFAVLPRVGEHVEVEADDTSHLYRVVAVRHPHLSNSGVCGLYAVYVGEAEEALQEIFKDTAAPGNSEESRTAGFLPNTLGKRGGKR